MCIRDRHKGLQLLQDARDEGIIPGEDAERLGDSFKRSLAQDQAKDVYKRQA